MTFETSDGVKLFYEVDGSGSPLVMLNGLWGDTSTWSNQIPIFSQRFTCIRLDHRGIGRSEKWAGSYSYDLHARDVKELLEHLGAKDASFLATCHGGMTAVTFAVKHPGRAKVLCINGTQLLRSERQRQVYLGWKRILETGGFEPLYRMIIPAIMSETWLKNNRDRFDSMLEATLARIEPAAALEMIEACVAYGFGREQIEALDLPALIMAGDDDMFMPARLIEAEGRLWKGSTFHLFEGCGHFPQREMPETYNAVVLKYLKSV